MPFVYDETEIEWPEDGSEPQLPRADQFVYLPAPAYSGANTPVRFSIEPPAETIERTEPQEKVGTVPPARPPRRGILNRLFGSRASAPTQQQRQTSIAETLRRQELENARRLHRLFATMIPALRAAGARRAYCRYDGGNDEGWAWLDHYETASGKPIDLDALARLLFEMNVHEQLRAAGFSAHLTAVSNEEEIAGLKGFASDWIAQDWATLLLGPSFGTGEYSMYGAFTVDLEACTITDDPQADPLVQNITIAE